MRLCVSKCALCVFEIGLFEIGFASCAAVRTVLWVGLIIGGFSRETANEMVEVGWINEYPGTVIDGGY